MTDGDDYPTLEELLASDLSVRTRNTLDAAQDHGSVRHLLANECEELRRLRDVGDATVREVRNWLARWRRDRALVAELRALRQGLAEVDAKLSVLRGMPNGSVFDDIRGLLVMHGLLPPA